MVKLVEQIEIDFQGTEDEDIIQWVESNGLDQGKLDKLTFSHALHVWPETFDAAELEELYKKDIDGSPNGWLQGVYRLLAEGDARGAMDALYREFPQLRPPRDERNLVLRLGAGGGTAHG
ncbi:hypothetical protein [Rhizobium binae]|uniref:hypothetical protein n=1 Tax=Rhizobium binae TaxID=1138190 RepID=UPI001C836D2F|nr:hypothetical protein [Rhizobium binae]MBX4944607.1 hypothetical protein [Rhizobium binae]MBX4980638.1 hypothetical protein [Rhizobium binae]